MIRFQYKADPVFEEILDRVIDDLILDCEEILLQGSQEQTDLVSERVISVFGGLQSFAHVLMKLQDVKDSSELFDISDYYFYLLDDILSNWVELYNSNKPGGKRLIHPSGKIIEEIDADDLIEHYFFDRDYTLDSQVAELMIKSSNFEQQLCDYSAEALNVARGILPDTSDLWIRRCDIDDVYSDDDENELEYEWFSEDEEFVFEDDSGF